MAQIKLNYFMNKRCLYIKTAQIIIEFHIDATEDLYTCEVYDSACKNNLFDVKEIQEHEIIFSTELSQRLKESMYKIEYSIKNNLNHKLTFADICIVRKKFAYTLKVIQRLKDIFGELTDEEKQKLIKHWPLDNKKWIIENIADAYGSISDELKNDPEILEAYMDYMAVDGVRDFRINNIPNHWLNNEDFLLRLKNKIIEKNKNNKRYFSFCLEVNTMINTKIYEVFKDMINSTSASISFNIKKEMKNENL